MGETPAGPVVSMPESRTGDRFSAYVCPSTHAPLAYRDGALQAEAGGRRYEIVDGIPSFLAFSPVAVDWGGLNLDELTAEARRIGWHAAFRVQCERLWGKNSSAYRYVADPARSSFLDLLDLGPQHAVLEVGTNAGQITEPLARRVGKVNGLDIVPVHLKFAAARCALQGLTNVELASGGDNCLLPFRDGYFDRVILNLVFEWVGSRNKSLTLIESQRLMLQEAHRVLRPGGTLYLSTKNRYAPWALRGGKDPHSHGLRFGSVMPRWLRAALLGAKKLPRAEGLLHSYGGLKRCLASAGFSVSKSYWVIPEPRFPARYVPFEAASIRATQTQRETAVDDDLVGDRLLRLVPAAIVPFFASGLVFVAARKA
jgi:SAM-dependent methyltransferase